MRIPMTAPSATNKVTIQYSGGSCRSRVFVTLQSSFNETAICDTEYFWNYGVATSFKVPGLDVPNAFDVIVSSVESERREQCCIELSIFS